MRALTKDGWTVDVRGGSQHIYRKGTRRLSVHFHPAKTYGAKTLQGLLDDTGWNEDDYRRLKLIK